LGVSRPEQELPIPSGEFFEEHIAGSKDSVTGTAPG